jgi:hypothetical protein
MPQLSSRASAELEKMGNCQADNLGVSLSLESARCRDEPLTAMP